MQMRSAPSVGAHHQRQETDTAVHEKTAFCENLLRMPYAIGQFTEIATFQAFVGNVGTTFNLKPPSRAMVGSNRALGMATQGPPTRHGRVGIRTFPEDGPTSRSNGKSSL
jgi:hypothetical protein